MARLFAVPRLVLISEREADRPRLARTPPELLPPGGVRSFFTGPTRKQARSRSSPERTDSATRLTGHWRQPVCLFSVLTAVLLAN